jgi:hypothetical protein
MASQPISLCADTRCGGCVPALRPACWRANHVARDWIEMRPLSFRLGDSRGLGLRGDMRAAKSLFFALYGGGLRKRNRKRCRELVLEYDPPFPILAPDQSHGCLT